MKKLLKRRRPSGGTGNKTLYLHIGHYKTGTSALQLLCDRNRAALAREGLDYLEYGCYMSKHSRFAFSLLKEAGVTRLMHGYDNPKSADRLWSELFEAVAASPAPRCLVSSEEFMRLGNLETAAAGLARVAGRRGDIAVKVVAYLRAPDDHLRSWYNQLVKMGVPVPDFEAAVAEVMEPVHYDYALALRPWIEVFGPDALILRPYDPASRTGTSLYADFLSVFGIDFGTDRFERPEADPNPRLDDRLLPLVRLMQNADMPVNTITHAQKRARAYLARERIMQEQPDQAFDTVVRRAEAGLDSLGALPGNGLDIEALRQALPAPQDPAEARAEELMGFLMAEIRTLRQQLNQNNARLAERIEALEKQRSRVK